MKINLNLHNHACLVKRLALAESVEASADHTIVRQLVVRPVGGCSAVTVARIMKPFTFLAKNCECVMKQAMLATSHPSLVSPIRIDDDLIAAALAAIHLYLEAEQSEVVETAPPRSAWQAAALVAAQGGAPARGDRTVAWRTVDRASRAARWSVGILGTFD